MPAVRIIPCLDVTDGRIVKGVRFVSLRDAGDPAEQARLYEAHGADELTMLDVSATAEARSASLATVRALRRELSIPLTVGGGVRCVETAGALLDAGADKVAVNSAAALDPSLIDRLAARFGSQCIVLAIDAAAMGRGRWRVTIRSGRERTDLDAVAWSAEAESRGAGEILLTSIDRDGTLLGYDLPLVRAVREVIALPIIASGGAANPAHMVEAVHAGADAVLAASIFHDGTYRVSDVKAALAAAEIPVREPNP